MRFRVTRLFGIVSLYLFVSIGLVACSGQQQEDEELEVTEQDQESQGEDQEGEYQGEDQEANEEYAQNEGEDGENYNNAEEGEELVEGENSTENDLQEIIQEMNGQQSEAVAEEANAEALQQNLVETQPVEEVAPMDAGMASAPVPQQAPVSGTSAPFQPGGTPAGPGLPELGSKMPYIVQPGDTLAKISGRIYNNISRWREMATLSGLANPSRIYPGDIVYYTLDDQSLAFATAYESVQRSEEQVQQGDTLATISQRVYGSSTAWKSIWRQNDNINNPDMLNPGSVVYYIQGAALAKAIKAARAELLQIAQTKHEKKDIELVQMSLLDADERTDGGNTLSLAFDQVMRVKAAS